MYYSNNNSPNSYEGCKDIDRRFGEYNQNETDGQTEDRFKKNHQDRSILLEVSDGYDKQSQSDYKNKYSKIHDN